MPQDARDPVQPVQVLIVQHPEKLVCRPGLLHLELATGLCGFAFVSQGRGGWLASTGRRLALAPDTVVSFSSEATLELSLETPAELLVVCMRRQQTAGGLHQQLFQEPTLMPIVAVAAAERLRGLFAMLSDANVEPDSRVNECLLEAWVWAVAEGRHGKVPGDRPDAAVQRALGILCENLGRPLRVSDLARRVGLSRAAFARRFSAALSMPPERYHTWLRLRRGAELLTTTDASLASIAAEVGYSSEFAFSRAFRRWYGVAPATYRRSPVGAPRIQALAA